MSKKQATKALKKFGLTEYEAKMVIGLEKLGASTARELSEVTSIPRSQVYSTADSLCEQGLIEIEQSHPQRYWPVGTDQIRSVLRSNYESQEKMILEYLSKLGEYDGNRGSSIRILNDTEAIVTRCVQQLEAERSEVLYLENTAQRDNRLTSILCKLADDGTKITIITGNDSEAWQSYSNISVYETQEVREMQPSSITRCLIIDNDWFLISLTDSLGSKNKKERAIISSDSDQAEMLEHLFSYLLKSASE